MRNISMAYFEEFFDGDGRAVDSLNEFIEANPDIRIINTQYQVIIDNGGPRTFILLQYECEEEEEK